MAKAKTDEEIGKIIARAISDTEDYVDGTLAAERTNVLRFYNGELPKPINGDPSYVSRDVHDVTDTMRANIVEAFSAHNRIVKFEASKKDGGDDAKQATAYCQQSFFKENDGAEVIYTTVTDGLMARIGVVKVYHEEDIDVEEYDFVGATLDEMNLEIAQDPELVIDEETIEFDATTNTYSAKAKKTIVHNRVVVENIQPNDFLIDNNARHVDKAKFVAHRTKQSRSWFVTNYGEDIADEINYGVDEHFTSAYDREIKLQSLTNIDDELELDESTREATLYECYVMLDVENTGKSQLWKVNYCSGKVLDKERVAFRPFAVFVPLPMGHTFIGENYAEQIIQIQIAKTISARQMLKYNLTNSNPRYMVARDGLLNPKELMDNRSGGIVNVERLDAIAPLPPLPMNPMIMPMIQMFNDDKEHISGVTKLSQGMNKDALSTQNAEGKVEMLISAAQSKQKDIARKFGDFIQDCFYLIYNTALDYVPTATIVETSGVEAEVNPTQWKRRNPSTIQLTLGYAEREREAAELTNLHMLLSQDPGFQAQYSPENRYELYAKIMESRGFVDYESYLTPPQMMPPPEPDPNAEFEMQQKQLSLQLMQAQIQQMQTNAEIEMAKIQNEARLTAIKEMEAETDRMRVANAMEVNQGKLGLDAQRTEAEIWKQQEEVAMAAQADTQTAILNP